MRVADRVRRSRTTHATRTSLALVTLVTLVQCASPLRPRRGARGEAPHSDPFISRVASVVDITEIALSPDGQTLAFVTDRTGSFELFTLDLSREGATPVQRTHADEVVSGLEWSPDSSRLLFGMDHGGDERTDLYVMRRDAASIERLTETADAEQGLRFAPDGARVAMESDPRTPFRFNVFVRDANGRTTQLTHAPINVQHPRWTRDGRTVVATRSGDDQRGDLLIIDVASGTIREVAPPRPEGIAYAIDPLPDGRMLVLATNARGFAQLATVDLASGRSTFIGPDEWDVEDAHVAADGTVVFSRNVHGVSEVSIMPHGDPSATRVVTRGGVVGGISIDRDAHTIAILREESNHPSEVVIAEVDGRRSTNGNSTTATATATNRVPTTHPDSTPPTHPDPTPPTHPDSTPTTHPDSTPPTHPDPTPTTHPDPTPPTHPDPTPPTHPDPTPPTHPDSTPPTHPDPTPPTHIDSTPTTAPTLRTVIPPQLSGLDPSRLAVASLRTIASFDNTPVDVFMWSPPVAHLGSPPPLVVHVHGGPNVQTRAAFSPMVQALTQAGFFVASVNYRGSPGYGRAFEDLNNHDWGGGDLRDIVHVVHTLASEHVVDGTRVGIYGGSFGGYMTLRAITAAPEVWSAAVDMYGMPDLVEDYRLTGDRFASWYDTEMGNPSQYEALYRDRSPIHGLDRVRAPLLVLQGENDTNVPRAESDTVVHALRARGRPVEYVVYPDEGHGFTHRANRVDSMNRTLAFFTRHLGTASRH